MRSIRRKLVMWLAGALAGGMALVMAATYLFAYTQITRVYDEELVHIAEAVHLGEDWHGPSRVRIPRPGFNLSVRAYDAAGTDYFHTAEPSMPGDVGKSFEGGLSTVRGAGGRWRVYTHVTPEGVVQVGQPEATRTALARQLSLRMALPELALIPLLVLSVGWLLRRGLEPLTEVSRRVEHRDAARLDPLPVEDVPEELEPLIEQLNALLARLGTAMAAQQRFVEDAAHELRTPVAALALQVQVAERAVEAGRRTVAFAELRDGIARVARVVEQLLRLGELGPEAPREHFQRVDLAELSREVAGAMAHRARQLGVDLVADAAAAAPMTGAPAELRSLITNLVDNALRYAPRDSEVTVRVRTAPSGVRMEVADAGPGIPALQRDAVFERFRRAEGDATQGSGLGLAIAKAIVQRHGGVIFLQDARPGSTPSGLVACVCFPGAA